MHTTYLIVGAGAAGCTLAWLLRQAKCNVLMLELRDMRKKNKLCGGIINSEAQEELKGIFGEDTLSQLALTYPSRLQSRCSGHELVTKTSFATMSRKRLDDWLLARCLTADVVVADRMRLVSVDKQARMATCENLRSGSVEPIHYDVIIGSDGASSTIRRLFTGRRQRTAVSLEGHTLLAGEDVVFSYHSSRIGYCWYIPADMAANVGCMLYEGDVGICRAWIDDFCKEMKISHPKLRGAPIPTGDDILLHADKGAWLIGDAAGLAEPKDGGGLWFAFMSARLLASSLLGGIPYDEAMEPIVAWFAREASQRRDWYQNKTLSIVRGGDCFTS